MLLSFAVTNFHSFADRTEVSLTLNKRDTVHGWDRQSSSGERVTTALALLGANGAGKSSLLKVGPFLSWFLQDSFDLKPTDNIPLMPHLSRKDEASEFEFESDDGHGWRWRYVLRATTDRVLHEALYRRNVNPGDRYSYVFKRDWNGKGYTVRQQEFGLVDSEAAKVRDNVSLVSWGRQYGAQLAVHFSDFAVSSNIVAIGRAPSTNAMWDAAELFSESDASQEMMRSLLRQWDLGLSDVRIQAVEAIAPGETQSRTRWFPFGVHHVRGKEFMLPFVFESSGTQTAFILLSRLLPTLHLGGMAFIDELESDLHPHMIEPILKLFHDRQTNPRGAQLIFTCQSPEVLRVLQRAQVVFIEKTDCESVAYRGDDIVGLDASHNLYAKYMSGALGAVPQL
ncbi:MAG: AAA family ATPase [Burkholderiaceae bacterium]|nr:AAA family ATPase [Burkholderiaceae bacterium]